jgi:Asp-tRNA(Asn)/Glu-tRNA(Gln) amidotransferase C subunit
MKKWLINIDYRWDSKNLSHSEYLKTIEEYQSQLDEIIKFKEVASNYPTDKIDTRIEEIKDKISETRTFLFRRDGFI